MRLLLDGEVTIVNRHRSLRTIPSWSGHQANQGLGREIRETDIPKLVEGLAIGGEGGGEVLVITFQAQPHWLSSDRLLHRCQVPLSLMIFEHDAAMVHHSHLHKGGSGIK